MQSHWWTPVRKRLWKPPWSLLSPSTLMLLTKQITISLLSWKYSSALIFSLKFDYFLWQRQHFYVHITQNQVALLKFYFCTCVLLQSQFERWLWGCGDIVVWWCGVSWPNPSLSGVFYMCGTAYFTWFIWLMVDIRISLMDCSGDDWLLVFMFHWVIDLWFWQIDELYSYCHVSRGDFWINVIMSMLHMIDGCFKGE
jgi:hypothetical protein